MIKKVLCIVTCFLILIIPVSAYSVRTDSQLTVTNNYVAYLLEVAERVPGKASLIFIDDTSTTYNNTPLYVLIIGDIVQDDNVYTWTNSTIFEYSRYGSNTSSEYRLTTIKNNNGYLNAGNGTVLYSQPDNEISMLYYILGVLFVIAFLKLVSICFNFFFRRHSL